jgi:putative RecB family exonuclease
VLPRLEDPFGAAELGVATHQVFEDLFGLPATERTIETAQDILAGLAEAHPGLQVPPACDVEARERWRDEIDRRMVGLWRIEDPTEVDVVAIEQRIEAEVAGVPFIAVVDRVDRNWDQVKVKLNDYKSGLAQPPKLFFGNSHGEQLRLYALAWAAHTGGLLPAAAQLYYVAHGKARKVGLARKKLLEASDGLVRAWERMQEFSGTAAFPTKASALCGWCPLVKVCPSAAAAGRAEP